MPQGPSFWFDTRIYLAVAAALLAVIVFYNPHVAVLGAILLAALYLYGRERYLQQQKAMSRYLDTMSYNVEQGAEYALRSLPLAMLMVDEAGRLYWYNNVLSQWFPEVVEIGLPVQELWPQLPIDRMMGQDGREIIAHEDRYYQVIYRPAEQDGEGELLVLYVSDITASEKGRAECLAAMPVLAYIQIDNYDDVLQGLNETLRTAVLGEVNKQLSAWVAEHDGVMKRYADDLFILIYNREQLERCLQDKFDILDKVRTIQVGNKIPVTLSMGVAADELSLDTLGERAQAGLDLALGRGGDQAAVHVGGKLQFYGGKAKAVEKNTRVKARIVAQALRESIGDCGNVLIMGHGNEDFDSLGASIGVARMAHQLKKPVQIVVSQPGISVNKLKDLLEDYEDYQELFVSPTQAAALLQPDTLLFVVDVHHPMLTAAPDLLTRAERIVVIDHHRRSESFIVNPLLVYLEPSASSASELVTELLMYFDETVELTRLDATALYAGIVVDTKNFSVQSGVRTFDAAAYLRRAGADPFLVRQLFRLDFDTVKSRAQIINQAEMLQGGAVVAICPQDIRNAQVVAAQVADMLLGVEGVTVSFVLFLMDDGVGVSARSQGEINVQLLMEELGGGGHQTVAGAQLRGSSMEDARQTIIALNEKYLGECEEDEGNTTTGS